jgi:hypothetical protein
MRFDSIFIDFQKLIQNLIHLQKRTSKRIKKYSNFVQFFFFDKKILCNFEERQCKQKINKKPDSAKKKRNTHARTNSSPSLRPSLWFLSFTLERWTTILHRRCRLSTVPYIRRSSTSSSFSFVRFRSENQSSPFFSFFIFNCEVVIVNSSL